MIILHTIALLAAAASVSSAQLEKTICENKLDTIACQGGLILKIDSVVWGRKATHLCNPYHIPFTNLNCASTKSSGAVVSNCQGRTTCLLRADNGALGGDPCPSTPKYLNVKYQCVLSLSAQTTPTTRRTTSTPRTTTSLTTRTTTQTTTSTTATPATTRKSQPVRYAPNANPNTAICHEYLVSGPRGVPDAQLTASSQLALSNNAHRGRLHTGIYNTLEGSWTAAATDTNPYIQVKMNWLTMVSGVVTQGRHVNPGTGCCQEWVNRYRVDYSIDGQTWHTVKDGKGVNKVFIGNTDTDTPITQNLDCPVVARFIRVYVVNYVGRASMRLELMGCPTNTGDLGNCQKGWKEWPGSKTCYYISDKNDKKSWENAYLTCKRNQGDVLKIDSIQEKAWIRGELLRLYSNQKLDHWWTGLNNRPRFDNNYFKWDDGSSLNTNVVRWDSGEPNNAGGVEHCGAYTLLRDGMNDLNCQMQLPFICEAPKYWKKPINVPALVTQRPTLPASLVPVTIPNKTPVPILVPVTQGPNAFKTGCVNTGDCKGRAWADYQSCNGCGFYLTCAPFGPVLRACPLNTKYDDITGACEATSTTCVGP